MTNLIVSMIRFSTALTLYSVEELERSMNVMEGGDTELRETIGRFGKTLNSLTGVLVNGMDRNRKETLDSVTKVSHEMVNRTMGGMDVMNPAMR